jgi:hypothetical protein
MASLVDDPGSILGLPTRDGLFPPALRRDLADLNGQYLDLGLAGDGLDDPRFAWHESVRQCLLAADPPTLARIAGVPFALFALDLPEALPAAAENRIEESRRDGGSVPFQTRMSSFSHQAVFFAWRLVSAMPLATCVFLDLGPATQAMLGELRPSQLAGLAARPDLVRPRWPRHVRFWEVLAGAARCNAAAALQWAHCFGLCLFGVDEAAAQPSLYPSRTRPRV